MDKGEESVLDALYVGARIEEIDIVDLKEAIDSTNETVLKSVYSSLLSASYNHLQAFVGNIEKRTGKSYDAQILDQKVVDDILN